MVLLFIGHVSRSLVSLAVGLVELGQTLLLRYKMYKMKQRQALQ